jgi:hypothetical protein
MSIISSAVNFLKNWDIYSAAAYWKEKTTGKKVEPEKINTLEAVSTVVGTGITLGILSPVILFSSCGKEHGGPPEEQTNIDDPEGNKPEKPDYPNSATGVDNNNDGDYTDYNDTNNEILFVDEKGNIEISADGFFDNLSISRDDTNPDSFSHTGGTPKLPIQWTFKGYWGNVDWTKYVIIFRTDPSKLEVKREDGSLITWPKSATTFSGLAPVNLASDYEKEKGYACQEEGYTDFLYCPSDPANRLEIYLARYKLTTYDENGNELGSFQNICIDVMNETPDNKDDDIDAFLADPSKFEKCRVPAIGENKDLVISIPEGDGNSTFNNARQIKVEFNLIDANDSQLDNAIDKTILDPRFINKEFIKK